MSLSIGLYGKLPGHGDFVARNLPNNLVQIWDGWLQAFIGSSQERLGQDWLNVYLTSPVWRFGFRPAFWMNSNGWVFCCPALIK